MAPFGRSQVSVGSNTQPRTEGSHHARTHDPQGRPVVAHGHRVGLCLALTLAATVLAATEGAEGRDALRGGIAISVLFTVVAAVLWRVRVRRQR